MRKIISASLVLSIAVMWANVAWAQHWTGRRGSTAQLLRGIQNRGSIQQSRIQATSNQRRGQGGRVRQGHAAGNVVGGALSSADAQGLIYMRQEEKLARDVYLTLGEKWNLPIFSKIAQAESRHMAAVGRLLVRYNLADPVAKDVRGQFADRQFNEMYRSFVASGSISPAGAIRVGVRIEELDIADLQAALNTARQEDIRKVYRNLLRGSQQHLRAFTSQLR